AVTERKEPQYPFTNLPILGKGEFLLSLILRAAREAAPYVACGGLTILAGCTSGGSQAAAGINSLPNLSQRSPTIDRWESAGAKTQRLYVTTYANNTFNTYSLNGKQTSPTITKGL